MINMPSPKEVVGGIALTGAAIFIATTLSSRSVTKTSFETDKNQNLVGVTLDSGIPDPNSNWEKTHRSSITCDPLKKEARIVGFTPDHVSNTLRKTWNIIPIPFKTADDDLMPTGKVKIVTGSVTDCQPKTIADLTKKHGFPQLTKAVKSIITDSQT